VPSGRMIKITVNAILGGSSCSRPRYTHCPGAQTHLMVLLSSLLSSSPSSCGEFCLLSPLVSQTPHIGSQFLEDDFGTSLHAVLVCGDKSPNPTTADEL